MTMYSDARGRVVDVGSSPVLRLLGLGISAFLVVILLFASVTRVQSGHVGVLTLFGRVTGEVLSEGIHMINPFKSSNEMSIRTQEIKESASVPSAEGLVMNLDTSLIYHLDPEKAADVYQKIGPNYSNVFIEPNLRAAIRGDRFAQRQRSIQRGARVGGQTYSRPAHDAARTAWNSGGEHFAARHPAAADAQGFHRGQATG